MPNVIKPRNIIFLRDVLVIGATTFGGPQAHLAMMLKIFVEKRRYITEEELLETSALCQMLPGPGSTQTITAIALKKGGPLLAILATLIWIFPAVVLMTVMTFLYYHFEQVNYHYDFLRFVQPMAIGFIAYAGFRVGMTVIKDKTGFVIMILVLLIAIFYVSPVTFPAAIAFGGIISNFTQRGRSVIVKEHTPIDWKSSSLSLILFFVIFLAAILTGALTQAAPARLFENFYRFGSITYGGGNVLIPMMFEQFVRHRHYLTAHEFLSGYAFSQSVPGPVFAFAAFTGGMALKSMGTHWMLFGCFMATIAIFLPSLLLIFFIYPFWQYLKNYRFIRRSLYGINAAATGLVLSAALVMYDNMAFSWFSPIVIIFTFCALQFTRIPAPVLVLIGLGLGFLFSFF